METEYLTFCLQRLPEEDKEAYLARIAAWVENERKNLTMKESEVKPEPSEGGIVEFVRKVPVVVMSGVQQVLSSDQKLGLIVPLIGIALNPAWEPAMQLVGKTVVIPFLAAKMNTINLWRK